MEGKGDPKQENSDGKTATSHHKAGLCMATGATHTFGTPAHVFCEATPRTQKYY